MHGNDGMAPIWIQAYLVFGSDLYSLAALAIRQARIKMKTQAVHVYPDSRRHESSPLGEAPGHDKRQAGSQPLGNPSSQAWSCCAKGN